MLETEAAMYSPAAKASANCPDERSKARISANFASFNSTVALAHEFFTKGEMDSAAVWAAIASHIATSAHCGVFSSPRLERMLNRIGCQLSDRYSSRAVKARNTDYRKVLHVGTYAYESGGLTRMLIRWTNADRGRAYSLALTQHQGAVPQHVLDAIGQSGGKMHYLNRSPGGLLRGAQELRRIARNYDAIILHIHCEDVVPLIAFAQPDQFPPVLFLNHADHLFWLGSSIGHVVINLRDAAMALSADRRGIDQERNLLLPTIVDPTVRTRSRADAKRELGIDPARTVLLSVARRAKYATFNGMTYAERHLPFLMAHPEVELIVVGAEAPSDWQPAIDTCSGRIKPLANQDPRPFYEAGDIYVDSYPFVSSTSMMEAAAYGMPLVTIFEAPKEASIFGINHVGLVGTALVAHNASEYSDILSRLLTDEEYRETMGAAARDAVVSMHTPPGWLNYLNQIFDCAAALPPIQPSSIFGELIESPAFGEPDCRHEDMFRSTFPMNQVIRGYLGVLPLRQRLRSWNDLRRKQTFQTTIQAASALAPEWIKRVVKG